MFCVVVRSIQCHGRIRKRAHVRTKTILIVEDDNHIRDLLEDILKEEIKCNVFGASDGHTALLLLHKVTPDLFLLDYRLPYGINGINLIYHIRSVNTFEHTPIILMSACLDLKLPIVQGVRFLRKPFELDILLRLVQEDMCRV